MPELPTRRHVLLAGASLMVSACTGRQRQGYASTLPTQAHLVTAPMLRTVPGPPLASENGFRYTVVSGDTLSSISRRSGVPVGTISRVNGLRSNLIRPGDELLLPGCDTLHADPLHSHLEAPDLPGDVPGDYALRSRATWTKRRVSSNHQKIGQVTRLTVHHTGEHAGMRGLQDIEIVQRIERYHCETRKWSAIGYHYLVGRDGSIYEGRPADIQGAHVSGANANNIGISCIGDFQNKRPGHKQLGALHAFLDAQRGKYRIGKKNVYGHRDLGNSICPGDQLYDWVKIYKRA